MSFIERCPLYRESAIEDKIVSFIERRSLYEVSSTEDKIVGPL